MKQIIEINRELCTGCSRCVRECPMETANITYQDGEGNTKVKVDHTKCVACGRCIAVCKHNARQYADDTARSYDDSLIERRDTLFSAVNTAATLLLLAEADEFESALWSSMGIMAGAVDADRMRLWKNYYTGGKLHCTQLFEWSETAAPQQGYGHTIDVSYEEDLPGWEDSLKNGRCINSIVRYMSPKEQARLNPQEILSILIVPVFFRNEFWGFVGFNDCHRERLFTANEESILRSGSLLIANALQRYEMTQELESALENARAASQAKSDFLSNMSHEIRTPMNSIMGFSELAIEENLPPKTKEYLRRIMENTKGLLQIINDVLDISKIESGKMELEIIPFDLHELLTACKSIISPKAIEKSIALYFYAEPSLRKKLCGDPTRLRQVLINLLSNAVKFTVAGKVSLITEIEYETDDEVSLRFEVKDTGIGMTPEQISRVFEPFIQADVSTTRKFGGTGLGLTITKNILDLMNSSISIDSEPGIGTSVSFTVIVNTLDASHEASGSDGQTSELEKPLFIGEILVCEDNKMNQQVITEHLARVGLATDIAENGLEGIKKVKHRVENKEKPYDLIFMDIHMPEMDGLEAAPNIIALESGTPIVAMTANIMKEDRELYKTLGMDDYVGKPFTSQELWQCLTKYLSPIGYADTQSSDDILQNQLKTEFVHSNQNMYNEITEAIGTGDFTLAHRMAHTLKSSAGLIGKHSLQQAAADAERALAHGGNEITALQMELLQSELKAALDDLAAYRLNKADPVRSEAEYKIISPDEALELFRELEALLSKGSPESLKLVDDLRCIPGSGDLIEQIEDFYFGTALKTLAELREKYDTIPGE